MKKKTEKSEYEAPQATICGAVMTEKLATGAVTSLKISSITQDDWKPDEWVGDDNEDGNIDIRLN
jgi:hypothetical protein